jgi:TRAP-type mannitol/chloroaromatic compound transport system permease small subunit
LAPAIVPGTLLRHSAAGRHSEIKNAAGAEGGQSVNGLLQLAHGIDRLNEKIGKSIIWLVLIAVLISAANAVVRKAFNISSNAFLEIQWYLFSGVFLLGAAWALQKNDHVRIDVISGNFSKRTQIWLEIFGTVFFLLPMTLMILWLSWPVFVTAYQSGEVSPSAGGLIYWPARLLVPVGFALLGLQGLSQLIKCFGFLAGRCPDPTEKEHRPSAEEELAEEIRRQREQQAKELAK